MRERILVVFVFTILLLSGCGGVQNAPDTVLPDGQESNRTIDLNDTTMRKSTTVSDGNISIRGGSLSINSDRIFSNLLALLELDANRPAIRIESETDTAGNETSALLVDDFGEVLGLTPPKNASATDRPGGFTAKNTVHVLPRNGSEPELERLLAHEFVHVIQYQKGWQSHLRRSSANVDANRKLLGRCLSEGSATYLTDEYVRRYSVDVESDTALMRREYLQSNGTEKYFYAPYYFCSRYLHSRLDSPAEVEDAYRNPPMTTEQVIHNYAPEEELPESLDVTVDETNTPWNRWTDSTQGELFTRVVLANVLSEDDAARAAAGWGNDRLIEFRNDGDQGYVWILHWDSTGDAEQFAETFGRYLGARGAGPDGCLDRACFEQRRMSPRMSAVLVGPRSFVSNVTVEAENSRVRVGMK